MSLTQFTGIDENINVPFKKMQMKIATFQHSFFKITVLLREYEKVRLVLDQWSLLVQHDSTLLTFCFLLRKWNL